MLNHCQLFSGIFAKFLNRQPCQYLFPLLQIDCIYENIRVFGAITDISGRDEVNATADAQAVHTGQNRHSTFIYTEKGLLKLLDFSVEMNGTSSIVCIYPSIPSCSPKLNIDPISLRSKPAVKCLP